MDYSDLGLTSDFFSKDSLAVIGDSGFNSANNLTSGAIRTGITIGRNAGGFVRIDGQNARIIVNDGTVDRILIGED